MSFNPVFSAIASGLMPDPYLTIDEWADTRRKLPRGASAEAGQYSTDRMPYLREVMQWLSPQDPTQQVKVLKGTQLGFTEVGNNVAMYYMDVVPTSQLMIMPTETLAKDHSNRKLTPSLRAMPYLAKRIGGGKTKDDIGGTFEKTYPGGMLKIAWAGSAANYRSVSARVLIMDDIDGFPDDVEGEGEPLDLGKKRTDSFGNQRKIYTNGTPTVKGRSKSDDEYEDSDRRRFYMPCPHCTPKDKRKQTRETMVVFEFEHFKFDYDEDTYELKSDVRFQCPHCGELIDEHFKTWMMDSRNGAKTIAENPGHPHKGLRVPSFYSPVGFLSWNEIVREFLQAKKAMNRGDIRKMKTWENTRNARAWEEDIDKVDVSELSTHKEAYAAEVPDRVLVLTMGTDVQKDRLEWEVVGWCRNYETYSIARGVFVGDPLQDDVWRMLDAQIMKNYYHESGQFMNIFAAGVDEGYLTTKVHDFCRARAGRNVFAVKGMDTVGADVVKLGRRTKHNFTRLLMGANKCKNELSAFLGIDTPGPGYMHFPDDNQYSEAYFKQFGAEYKSKDGKWRKFSSSSRNEAIDIRNINYAVLKATVPDLELLAQRGPILQQSSKIHRRGRRIISRGRNR